MFQTTEKNLYTESKDKTAECVHVRREACILSLCGLCCSDKFRVCPDFLESLIPKIPLGDSKHPVRTKTMVTKNCDHDHISVDTHAHAHTHANTGGADDLTFTTQAYHILSTHTQTQPL